MKFNLRALFDVEEIDIQYVIANNDDLDAFFNQMEAFLARQAIYIALIQDRILYRNPPLCSERLTTIVNHLNDIGFRKAAATTAQLVSAVKNKKSEKRDDLIPAVEACLNDVYDILKPLAISGMKNNNNGLAVKDPSDSEAIADENDTINIKISDAVKKLDEAEQQRKPCILAVDDMADVLNAVTSILGDVYTVFGITKSEHVVRFLSKNMVDLFLLDIEMPGIDGYTLSTMIRNIPQYKDTPIIFLTSNATAEYIKAAMDMGVSGFIRKPFDPDVLLEKLKSTIKKKYLFPLIDTEVSQ